MKVLLSVICLMLACTSLCFARSCPQFQNNEVVIDPTPCQRQVDCTYGEWQSKIGDITVFDKPNGKEIAQVSVNEKFQALYGETHVTPIKMLALNSPPADSAVDTTLKAGDIFYLLGYLGEGFFNACMNGEAFLIDCRELPDIDGYCSISKRKPWAKVMSSASSRIDDMWVQIKTKSGIYGWIEPNKYQDIRGRNPADD